MISTADLGSDVTDTRIEPSASAITRSVFESNAMLPRRMLYHGVLPRGCRSSFLRKSVTSAEIFLLRVGGECFQVDGGALLQRALQIGNRRDAPRPPSRPKAESDSTARVRDRSAAGSAAPDPAPAPQM